MAIIDKNGGIRGTAGSVVYRTYRGKNIVQSRPSRRKQTPASIRSASEFGLSSSAARIIRQAFQPVYRDRHDGRMVNRLTSAVSRCIRASEKERGERDLHDGDLSYLLGFNFNANSPLEKYLKVRPAVSFDEQGQLKVNVPAIQEYRDLSRPFDEINRCRIRFLLIAINFREEFFEYTDVKELIIERSEQLEAQELIFNSVPPKGSLLLLTLSIEFQGYNRFDKCFEHLNTKEINPCEIIAAIPAKDEAPQGYAQQYYEEQPPASRKTMVRFGSLYAGPRLRLRVDKLEGKGRYKRPNPPETQAGTPGDPGWKEVTALKGTRTSFKQ